MKADLHVHSKYSKRPSQWVLQKINCPESFTEPIHLYKMAKDKGMSLVTLTDHNSIEGALELAHLPDAFISEEVTTYFPDDGCKIHVLAWDITEEQHQELQKARENIFDLVACLQQKNIVHSLAHPLFAVNERLTVEHFEKLLLLFKNFEMNGARSEHHNQFLRSFLEQLSPEDIRHLAEKHRLEPAFEDPWKKNLTGGSDDHSSLSIAKSYTEVEGAGNVLEFLLGLQQGCGRAMGEGATPKAMAHNLYGIAYQFYKNKLSLDRHVQKDILLRFLDRMLCTSNGGEGGILTRLTWIWSYRRWPRSKTHGSVSTQQLFRLEAQRLILDDPELIAIVKNGESAQEKVENRWFEFVNKATNKLLLHSGTHVLDQLAGANLFNIFKSLGSAGVLYSLLAPYFMAFSIFTADRRLMEDLRRRFPHLSLYGVPRANGTHVAHFTDTLYEVNGVALTLRQQVQRALSPMWGDRRKILSRVKPDGSSPPMTFLQRCV